MTPEIQAAIAEHDLSNMEFYHTNLMASQCNCWHPSLLSPRFVASAPVQSGLQDGGICFRCGGLTIRTGTCTTCTSCGETGGCG